MSRESAIAFWNKLKEDQALQEKVVVARNGPNVEEKIVALVKEAGFDCTLQDLESIEDVVRADSQDAELSPEQLDEVAGGAAPRSGSPVPQVSSAYAKVDGYAELARKASSRKRTL